MLSDPASILFWSCLFLVFPLPQLSDALKGIEGERVYNGSDDVEEVRQVLFVLLVFLQLVFDVCGALRQDLSVNFVD